MGDASERLERLLTETMRQLRARPAVRAQLAELTDPKAKAALLADLAIKQLRDDPAAVALIEQAAG
jgi:hypothetical protein